MGSRPAPISGKAFWKSLPEEIRKQFPPRVKRVVIDVPHNGPVRVLYEAHGSEEVASLVKAVIRADVEITEATPLIVEVPKDATLVLHVPSNMRSQAIADMLAYAQKAFNHSRVAILPEGVSVGVVKTEGEEECI